jgi:anti-sigma factor RsiW
MLPSMGGAMPVLLIRYAYASDLPPAEQNAVEKHLQHCAECRELVAFIRQTQGVARDPLSRAVTLPNVWM